MHTKTLIGFYFFSFANYNKVSNFKVSDLSNLLKPMMIAILTHDKDLKDLSKIEIESQYDKNCKNIVNDFVENMKIESNSIKNIIMSCKKKTRIYSIFWNCRVF